MSYKYGISIRSSEVIARTHNSEFYTELLVRFQDPIIDVAWSIFWVPKPKSLHFCKTQTVTI